MTAIVSAFAPSAPHETRPPERAPEPERRVVAGFSPDVAAHAVPIGPTLTVLALTQAFGERGVAAMAWGPAMPIAPERVIAGEASTAFGYFRLIRASRDDASLRTWRRLDVARLGPAVAQLAEVAGPFLGRVATTSEAAAVPVARGDRVPDPGDPRAASAVYRPAHGDTASQSIAHLVGRPSHPEALAAAQDAMHERAIAFYEDGVAEQAARGRTAPPEVATALATLRSRPHPDVGDAAHAVLRGWIAG